MALIKCNHCGQMVSDKAKVCPKCGTLVRSNSETLNESQNQVYTRYMDSSMPAKKNTSPALIATIALLCLAVLALGGFFLYKMVYEPSQLAKIEDQNEVLIDFTSVEEEPDQEKKSTIKEEPAETAADYADEASTIYPKRFILSGNMAGFPMTINVSLENGYPGKCSGIYKNIKYKTKMNLSGSFEGGQLRLIGYADGTSYTFNLGVDDYGNFNGYCETGNGKTLNVSLEIE